MNWFDVKRSVDLWPWSLNTSIRKELIHRACRVAIPRRCCIPHRAIESQTVPHCKYHRLFPTLPHQHLPFILHLSQHIPDPSLYDIIFLVGGTRQLVVDPYGRRWCCRRIQGVGETREERDSGRAHFGGEFFHLQKHAQTSVDRFLCQVSRRERTFRTSNALAIPHADSPAVVSTKPVAIPNAPNANRGEIRPSPGPMSGSAGLGERREGCGSSRISRAGRRDGVMGEGVGFVAAVAVDNVMGDPETMFPAGCFLRAFVAAPLANDALLKNCRPVLLRCCAFRRRAGMSATVMPVVNASCCPLGQ